MKCKYCLRDLERKIYPKGDVESDKRFYTRLYCDIHCCSKSRAYENAKNLYKILKEERQEFIKNVIK